MVFRHSRATPKRYLGAIAGAIAWAVGCSRQVQSDVSFIPLLLVLLVANSDEDKKPLNTPLNEGSSYPVRAQRFPIVAPLHYRERGETAWHEGTTINISRSGVLFHCDEDKEPQAVLQMRIAFPPELTGSGETHVVCWGPIVRKESPRCHEIQHTIAASIFRYRFES